LASFHTDSMKSLLKTYIYNICRSSCIASFNHLTWISFINFLKVGKTFLMWYFYLTQFRWFFLCVTFIWHNLDSKCCNSFFILPFNSSLHYHTLYLPDSFSPIFDTWTCVNKSGIAFDGETGAILNRLIEMQQVSKQTIGILIQPKVTEY
jgi:hypothetical protein